MKKNTLYFLCFITAAFLFSACQDKDDNEAQDLSGTDMLTFSVNGYSGEGIIDSDNKTIYLQVPVSIKSGTNLCPRFTLSEGATATVNNQEQISGNSKQDFKSTVTYTITAGNKTDQSQWKVTITNNDHSIPWGLGYFIAEEHSNNGNSSNGYYLQQHDTGPYSNDNCGPTCAVMAALWTDPSFPYSVEEARNEFPKSTIDGSITWYPQDVQAYLNHHGITTSMITLETIEDKFVTQITNELKNGHIIIICLDMQYVTFDKNGNSEYHIHKFYNGTIGHFLVVKGYKIVDGTVWMEVNDPWGMNLKYADGSYKGNNRYYRAGELSIATSKHNTNAIIIFSE